MSLLVEVAAVILVWLALCMAAFALCQSSRGN